MRERAKKKRGGGDKGNPDSGFSKGWMDRWNGDRGLLHFSHFSWLEKKEVGYWFGGET